VPVASCPRRGRDALGTAAPPWRGVLLTLFSAPLRLRVNLLFPSCLLRLGRVSARDGGITAPEVQDGFGTKNPKNGK